MPSFKLLVIRTKDLDATRRFYAALGVDFQPEQHGAGPVHYSATLGDMVLEIYPLQDGVVDSSRLGFAVDDQAEVIERLRQLGSQIAPPQETPWGMRTVARDPDGRAVEIYRREK